LRNDFSKARELPAKTIVVPIQKERALLLWLLAALIYTHLVNFKDEDYTAKVAHPEQEVCQLIEAGFEFVCDYEDTKVFRKRK
jgi:hypothetical protein